MELTLLTDANPVQTPETSQAHNEHDEGEQQKSHLLLFLRCESLVALAKYQIDLVFK